jgi:hypothetical protein
LFSEVTRTGVFGSTGTLELVAAPADAETARSTIAAATVATAHDLSWRFRP